MIDDKIQEQNGISSLMEFVSDKSGLFILVFGKKRFEVKFQAMWEGDNGLDLNDPNYEEFDEIGFILIGKNEGIAVNRYHLPDEIYYEEKLIFKKVDESLVRVNK